MDYLIDVNNDLFFISSRIKEINNNYTLLFNALTKKYEVHDLSNHVCSLAISVFPHELDERVIQKLFLSRKENMKNLFRSLDESNQKLQQNKLFKTSQMSKELLSDIVNYSSSARRELSQKEIRQIVNKFTGENECLKI